MAVLGIVFCLAFSPLEPPSGAVGPIPAQAGSPFTVLYDEIPCVEALATVLRPGVERFAIVYQSADPQASTSGVIDSSAVVEAIRRIPGGLPDYAMLDFENPFLEVLSKGPTDPRYPKTLDTMRKLIREVRTKFPQTKWSYYAVPGLPYWIGDGKNWLDAPDSLKRETLEKAFGAYRELVSECDWLSPSIYALYDPKYVPYQTPTETREQGRAWRLAQVLLARRMAGQRPVIPIVCPWWGAGGAADFCHALAPAVLVEDVYAPAIQGGAGGFCIWSAASYTINLVTDPDQSKYGQEKNFGTSEWRKAMVTDYLGGQAPTDWSEARLRKRLASGVSDTIAQAIRLALRQGSPRVKVGSAPAP
jgi:hypothetical protein